MYKIILVTSLKSIKYLKQKSTFISNEIKQCYQLHYFMFVDMLIIIWKRIRTSLLAYQRKENRLHVSMTTADSRMLETLCIQTIKSSDNPSIHQSIIWSINHTINQAYSINRSINDSFNQSINKRLNHSINQSINA